MLRLELLAVRPDEVREDAAWRLWAAGLKGRNAQARPRLFKDRCHHGAFLARCFADRSAARPRCEFSPRPTPLPGGERPRRQLQATSRLATRRNLLLDELHCRAAHLMLALATRLLGGCVLCDP